MGLAGRVPAHGGHGCDRARVVTACRQIFLVRLAWFGGTFCCYGGDSPGSQLRTAADQPSLASACLAAGVRLSCNGGTVRTTGWLRYTDHLCRFPSLELARKQGRARSPDRQPQPGHPPSSHGLIL